MYVKYLFLTFNVVFFFVLFIKNVILIIITYVNI